MWESIPVIVPIYWEYDRIVAKWAVVVVAVIVAISVVISMT
jgi:hypothetical protein